MIHECDPSLFRRAGNAIRQNPRRVAACVLLSLTAPACGDDDSAGDQTRATFDRTMTVVTSGEEIVPLEACFTDEDSQRQPLVEEEPPTIEIRSECNPPADAPAGLYATPFMTGERSIAQLPNGTRLVIKCFAIGEPITDVRGPASESDVWIGVETPSGQEALIPEVNLGYVREDNFVECQPGFAGL